VLLEVAAFLALACSACEERGGYPFGLPRTDPAPDAGIGKVYPLPASPGANDGPAIPAAGPQPRPSMISRIEPVYPIQALREGITGHVVVRFQIAPDGEPINATIVSSTNPVFDSAVLFALSRSRFAPQTQTATPYAGNWFKQPYAFRLAEEAAPPFAP
jgi:TonB family protein